MKATPTTIAAVKHGRGFIYGRLGWINSSKKKNIDIFDCADDKQSNKAPWIWANIGTWKEVQAKIYSQVEQTNKF